MSTIGRNPTIGASIDQALSVPNYHLERLRSIRQAVTVPEALGALRQANIFEFSPSASWKLEIPFAEHGPTQAVETLLGAPRQVETVGQPEGPARSKRYALVFNDGTSHPWERYAGNAIGVVVEHMHAGGSVRHYFHPTDAQIASVMTGANAAFGASGIYHAAINLPLARNL